METAELLVQSGYEPAKRDHDASIDTILRSGLSYEGYRQIVVWLASEIKKCIELDEAISSIDDLNSLALEISSFLKELACPYGALLEGPMSGRFRTECDALLLVDYLVGECMAGRMLKRKRELEQEELLLHTQISTPEIVLEQIFRVLRLETPPKIQTNSVFSAIEDRLEEDGHDSPKLLFCPKRDLTDDEWNKLDQCHTELQEEYNLRRKMMLKRLEVTMTSFLWKANTSADVARIYRQKKRELTFLQESLNKKDSSELLAANRELLNLEKVSSARLEGKGKNVYQGHLILPGRGGVLSLHNKPWMPMWSSREEGIPYENLRRVKQQRSAVRQAHKAERKSKKSRRGSKGGDIDSDE